MVAGAGDAWDRQVLGSFPDCGASSTSSHPWLGSMFIGPVGTDDHAFVSTVALLSMTTRQFPNRPTILVTSGDIMESDGMSAEGLAAKVGCPSPLQRPSPGSHGRGETWQHRTKCPPTCAQCGQTSRVCPHLLHEGAMWSCKVQILPCSSALVMQVQQRKGCCCDPCGSNGPLGRGRHGAHLPNLPPRGREGFQTRHQARMGRARRGTAGAWG